MDELLKYKYAMIESTRFESVVIKLVCMLGVYYLWRVVRAIWQPINSNNYVETS